MRLYESVSLKNAWWNVCCPKCGEPMAEDPWRRVNVTWSEVLGIAFDLWGKPYGFFVRDFLISLEFLKGQVVLTFCSQGSRRGEVEASIPAGDGEASGLLKAFLDRVRAAIEDAEAQAEDPAGAEQWDDDMDWEEEWEDD